MLSDSRIRLALLLTVLAVLATYAVVTRSGLIGGGGSESFAGADCPAADAPVLDSASRQELRRLRDDLGRPIASLDPRLRTYEEGPIVATSAWSDTEPGEGGPLPAHAPAGYEMRWWAPSGDDVVVDGMVFPTKAEAGDFLERAASTDCRTESTTVVTASPPGGRNLQWRNPDQVIEQDAYMRRGPRVYRVAVVRPDAKHRPSPSARREAFKLVDVIACLLPDAGCRPSAWEVPA